VIHNTTSRTVVLEDMVTVEDTNDPGLKDEIAEEAQNYGKLENIEILIEEKKNPDNQVVSSHVIIKLYYAEVQDANKACHILNGRLFAGRKIRASLE
jgi:hypothetical protein